VVKLQVYFSWKEDLTEVLINVTVFETIKLGTILHVIWLGLWNQSQKWKQNTASIARKRTRVKRMSSSRKNSYNVDVVPLIENLLDINRHRVVYFQEYHEITLVHYDIGFPIVSSKFQDACNPIDTGLMK
jgi:hypothetical protein